MEYEKDYSLLRPFDLEAAKRGEAICWHSDGEVLQDVTITQRGSVCGVWKESAYRGEYFWCNEKAAEKFRMAPLAWVEGKPVYKGDVLYHHKLDRAGYYKFIADDFSDGQLGLKSVPDGFMVACPENLTWTPPKVKRKVKLLAYLFNNEIRWYSETTKLSYHDGRIPSEDKVVEVED